MYPEFASDREVERVGGPARYLAGVSGDLIGAVSDKHFTACWATWSAPCRPRTSPTYWAI